MLQSIALLSVCAFSVACFAEDKDRNLPTPHYHPQQSDPAWMAYAVQLHGHLGPMLVFGARMGMAALGTVDAKGYFDVEVTCEGPFDKPPASCFLDGLQISTGATLGKRNLQTIASDRIVVRVKNTHTGKTAELRPREEFMALLPRPEAPVSETVASARKPRPDDDHSLDDLSRRIALMPEREILSITHK
jgi:formylmethanofuran dehydrogenase subunit E